VTETQRQIVNESLLRRLSGSVIGRSLRKIIQSASSRFSLYLSDLRGGAAMFKNVRQNYIRPKNIARYSALRFSGSMFGSMFLMSRLIGLKDYNREDYPSSQFFLFFFFFFLLRK